MNTLDELKEYFDQRFDGLETKMGGLESRMDGLEQKIDDLAESTKAGFAVMATKDELRATEARLSQRIIGTERRLGGVLYELVDVLGEKQVLSHIEIDRVQAMGV